MAWISGEGLQPFIHGAPFLAFTDETVLVYRLDPNGQHPEDVWFHAPQPAGVRLEFRAWGLEVTVSLRYPEPPRLSPFFGPQTQVSLWMGAERIELIQPGQITGDHEFSFDLPVEGAHYAFYLPYLCQAEIVGIRTGGRLEAVMANEPRWLAYGDSITHGWCASDPGLTYPAIASREFALNHMNLGFSGTARGEPSTAASIAALPADVISLAFGTNVYKSDQHDKTSWRETFETFLSIVREGHPHTPILVVTPIYRGSLSPNDDLAPGVFESTPTSRGLLHEEIREVEKDVVAARMATGDFRLRLISGLDIIGMGDAHYLADGIHPNDAGLERMAHLIGSPLHSLVAGKRDPLQKVP